MTRLESSAEVARIALGMRDVRAVMRDLRYRRGLFASGDARQVQIERLRGHLEPESLERRIFDAAEVQRIPFKSIAATLGISLRHLYRVRRTMMAHLAAAGNVALRDPSLQISLPGEEAFEAYCHGQFLLQRRSSAGLADAVVWFEKATRLAPKFDLAYAGLASALVMRGIYMHVAPEQAFPAARDAANRALRLNEDLAEAHTSLAEVRCYFDHDWEGARIEHERAVALQPSSPPARHSRAWFYVCRADLPRALAESAAALCLEPSSLMLAANRARLLSFTGRHCEALAQLANVLHLDPDFSLARYFHAVGLFAAGRFEDALEELELLRGFAVHAAALRAECQARLGRTAIARRALRKLQAPSSAFVPPYLLAGLYVALGEPDNALEMLERSFLQRIPWTPFALVDPVFSPLRDLARFRSLERSILEGAHASAL